MVEHIDFHISYSCDNKCVFCSSSGAIMNFRANPPALKDILEVLRKKRVEGFKSVNFTGGEPTRFTPFVPLISEAKKMGYRTYVGTGGGRFAEKKFCAASAGYLDEVCFSCHGHTPGLHNSITGNKKSFSGLESAMDNLSGFPVRFSSNTVATAHNLDSLKDVLAFLIKKKIKQALISNLAPEGRGLEHYDRLAVRLSRIKEKTSALAKMADDNGVVLRFFGIPACVLGEYACHSNDFSWDPRLNIERKKKKRSFLGEEKCLLPTRGRIKTAKCRECLYSGICGGVFREYYDRFGDEELGPFRA